MQDIGFTLCPINFNMTMQFFGFANTYYNKTKHVSNKGKCNRNRLIL